MARSHILPAIALCLSGCGEQPARTARSEATPVAAPKILYEHERHNIAELYDLQTATVEMHSKGKLDEPTEFGGPLLSCTTDRIHCQRSGLTVAVPRERPFPERWGNEEIACERRSPADGSAELAGRCAYAGEHETLFEYSTERGITRFRRVCEHCYDGWFVLRSQRGLFAAAR